MSTMTTLPTFGFHLPISVWVEAEGTPDEHWQAGYWTTPQEPAYVGHGITAHEALMVLISSLCAEGVLAHLP